jgi:hypothetical protein
MFRATYIPVGERLIRTEFNTFSSKLHHPITVSTGTLRSLFVSATVVTAERRTAEKYEIQPRDCVVSVYLAPMLNPSRRIAARQGLQRHGHGLTSPCRQR